MMAWALLGVGVGFALVSLHAYRPLARPYWLVLIAWAASWIPGELPLHSAFAQLAIAAAMAAAGGLESWPGYVGLAATALSYALLVGLFARSRAAARQLQDALREAGIDYAPRRPSALRIAGVAPLRRRCVACTRNVEYHRVGRRRLRLDVYAPRTRPDKAPVLLFTHGGGWVIGNKWQQGLVTVNELAARGWVCVTINYRLSPGATFPDHLLDLKRAIKWVRENVADYGGDPGFVVLCGGSAGAHLSALAALTPNALEYQREFPDVDTSVQGCVGYYGVYDFLNRHRHWPHGGLDFLLERAIMKRRRADAIEEFAKASPVERIGPHAPPFYLLHGDRDNLAPVHESRRFVERLRERSPSPVAYAELRGAQHAFDLVPSVRAELAIDSVAAFCEHLYAARRAELHSGYVPPPPDGLHTGPARDVLA